jgi:recombination protein RecT
MAAPAVVQTPKPSVVAIVQRQLDGLIQKNALHFPEDYDLGNALASAKLELQRVTNKAGEPIVDSNGRPNGKVTEASMVNAIFDMCVQGLNVSKKQGYFIVYGNQLLFQRSYFGDMALAKRVSEEPIDFYFDTIRKGDEFITGKLRTDRKGWIDVVSKHNKPWPRGKEIVGAYAGLINTETGEDLGLILFDMDRIRKSWQQGATKGNSPAHNNFPDEMAMKTVIRRICKPIINSSSDEVLLTSILRQDEDQFLGKLDEDEKELGNNKVIDISRSLPAESGEVVPEHTFAEEPVVLPDEAATPAPATAEVSQSDGPEVMSIEDAAKALKLNEDRIQFVKEQLGDNTASFLTVCVREGDKTWKDISDRLKAVAANEPTVASDEEGPGY